MTRRNRVRPISRFYTFGVSHSLVKLQVLSSHSVFDLIDTICKHTQIGLGEGVHDHLWNVTVGGEKFNGKCFIGFDEGRSAKAPLETIGLTPGMKLDFEYNFYKSTSHYDIFFIEETELSDNEDENNFPRLMERKPPIRSFRV